MSGLKDRLKKLSKLGIEVNHSLDSGVSLFGLNVSRSRARFDQRSSVALKRCLDLKPATVLDVGSGGGYHAEAFQNAGARVTCIDFGTSIYANDATDATLKVINTDFNRWSPDQKYTLVWASHVLEHQRNVGHFVDKLIECCAPDGHIAITVPFPHRRLWGGHLSLWTPGLLAYNVVLSGVDLRDAYLFYGYRETTLIFRPTPFTLPALTYDSGDIDMLAPYLPRGFRENGEPWF